MPLISNNDHQLDLGSLPVPFPGVGVRPCELRDPQYEPQSHLPVSWLHRSLLGLQRQQSSIVRKRTTLNPCADLLDTDARGPLSELLETGCRAMGSARQALS